MNTITTLGAPTRGLWCHRCRRPSALVSCVYAITARGMRLTAWTRRCNNCDTHITQRARHV